MSRQIKSIDSLYNFILNNKKVVLGEADISGIDELVYNPATGPSGTIGYGYDGGKKVRGIKWKNHDGHLHVGFTNREVAMAVIDKADSMGLITTENPYAKKDPTGKVEKVHAKNSFHYKIFPGLPEVGGAVDILGNPSKITELIKWIDEKYAGSSFDEDPFKDSGDESDDLSKDATIGLASGAAAAASGGGSGFFDLSSKGLSYGQIIGQKESIQNSNDMLSEATKNSDQIFGGGSFKWGGGPKDHGSRPLGNWQSDNAWDIMAPAGTPVYAIEGGKVVGLGGSPNLRKGVIYGYQVTIQGEDNSFFYTHLGERAPGIDMGVTVKKGDIIGWIGKPNDKWPQHVHVGLKSGNIDKYMDKSGNLVGHTGGSTEDVTQSTDTNDTQGKTTDGVASAVKSNLIDLLTTKTTGKGLPQDTMLMNAMKGLGGMFGLKESFGKNVIEQYGTITIPAKFNQKIVSPVDAIVDREKYSKSCKNQLLLKLDGGLGYLQFCGISKLQVRVKDKVSAGTILGKTSDDVEVVFFDKSFTRKNLKNDSFDFYQPNEFSKEKNKKKTSSYKQEKEPEYFDPALAAIPTIITSLFKDKKDDETGEVEKRWGYATDKEPVDPWIVKGISKPFEKLGKFLGTNKKVNETKLNENIERIKKLLK